MSKKPEIRYEWRKQHVKYVAGMGAPGAFEYRVCWSLYGANGEFMCGDGGQGYQDKTDARRALGSVADVMSGNLDWSLEASYVKEVGPGRKPKQ